ncbi:MAG: UPF0324 membrane protein [Phycisphaerae bacterium]|nr:MAG: UPF0324 membrane protein [Phycisphaerae bacterium]
MVAVAGPWPWARADLALLVGIVLALAGLAAFEHGAKAVSKYLIQACVVLLGLRLDLSTLARAAADGFTLAIATILGALALGLVLGRVLRTGREVSTLVSAGTAICGGSAIAAVGASIRAASASMAVATGAIFVLNAVGLWTLPPIGHALGLTDAQFGTWAGVALHDIASVNGAAKSFGPEAVDTANVVKMVRVVWIFPLALAAGWIVKPAGEVSAKRPPFPWFILLFVLASAARTWVPGTGSIEGEVKHAAGMGFQAALFLIGTGLSRAAMKRVGWRALVQAAVLWVLVAAGSLAAVMYL